MKDRPILLGSLAAGLLASACCIGPLVLGAVGLGSLGLGAWLAPARPWFLALTAVFLAIGFYLAYRPVRAGGCESGRSCEPPETRLPQRVTLWVVTLATIGLGTYPSWGARPSGVQALSAARDSSAVAVTLDVGGMTCDACGPEIERGLREVPGVVRASVDYGRSRAEIVMADASIEPSSLIAAVEKAGYRASVMTPGRANEARAIP